MLLHLPLKITHLSLSTVILSGVTNLALPCSSADSKANNVCAFLSNSLVTEVNTFNIAKIYIQVIYMYLQQTLSFIGVSRSCLLTSYSLSNSSGEQRRLCFSLLIFSSNQDIRDSRSFCSFSPLLMLPLMSYRR